MNTPTAIVIGRHAPDLGSENIKVVRQENITFSSDPSEAMKQLRSVVLAAQSEQIDFVLLQMVPTSLAVGLAREKIWQDKSPSLDWRPAVGVIVSQPGERPAGVTKDFVIAALSYDDIASNIHMHNAEVVEAAIKAANPRAKVEILPPDGFSANVTVRATFDPSMWFEFSHIEWLTND